jgi:uncharacterized protein
MVSGAISEATIRRAVDLLRAAAPGARVILFGSYARGDANARSDLDFLVIEPTVTARRQETARLLDVLRPLRIPVDVIVASSETYERWRGTPGTVLYEAAREGRAFDAAA